MSGVPIWDKRTGTVVAVIEGKHPRGSLVSPPDGYGIELKYLWPVLRATTAYTDGFPTLIVTVDPLVRLVVPLTIEDYPGAFSTFHAKSRSVTSTKTRRPRNAARTASKRRSFTPAIRIAPRHSATSLSWL